MSLQKMKLSKRNRKGQRWQEEVSKQEMHELMMAEATTGEFDLQGSMKR
jgi:hypothetical protein